MNVDWGPQSGPAHTDPAFPALARVLSPAGSVGGPVAVYHYPGRTLQAVHAVADGTLVVTEAVPAGAAPPALLAGHWWDAELHAVRRRLPLDPGLPALAAIAQRSGLEPSDLADRLLAYLPGRRAVLRLDGLVAKIGDPGTTVRNHDRQSLLWAHPGRSFAMARPRVVDARLGVRWEDLADGTPLLRELATRPAHVLAADVAAQLAALHRLPPPVAPLADHGAATALERWRRKTVRTIGRALPDLAPRAADVVARLADRMPAPAPARLVHGDFHAANVLVGSTGAVLLDLDELGLGDPELDLAVMTGRLLLVAAADPQAPLAGATVRLATALVGAYEASAGRPVRSDAFSWYLAGTLVGRQVKTSIRHLAPGLHPLATRVLDLAEAVLDDGARDGHLLDPVRLVELLGDLVVPAAAAAR